MKSYTTCMQCLADNGIPNFSSHSVERIPDDGVIELTCDRGHHTFILIQQAKFEILAEIAVTAIGDGYYREAVASFTASLERLYEYFIDVVRVVRGVDKIAFDKAWHPMKNASERQFGAFILTYLFETKEVFRPLGEKMVNLRNKVIHQGLIPDRKQAVDFGQAVGDCAIPLISLLHTAPYEAARHSLIVDDLRKKAEKAVSAGARSSTSCLDTPFDLKGCPATFDLEAVLAERARRPKMVSYAEESPTLARRLTEAFVRQADQSTQ